MCLEVQKTVSFLCETLTACDSTAQNFKFVLEQLELLSTKNHGCRYSSAMNITALKLFLCNRSCYKQLHTYLALPHPASFKSIMGSFVQIGSENEARQTVMTVFSQLNGPQRKCLLLLDEVYIKPSLR